jgi:hypothetical protein
MGSDIFVSHIEEDAPTALALARELRSLGETTWTYEEDGVAGISYLSQIYAAIENCRAFVLLASQQSVKAHQVVKEVEQAHEREKIIIAVRLGLTHQEFISANPILRMASGTAVTLAVEDGNLSAIARRIAATLTFAKQQKVDTVGVRETPRVEQSVRFVVADASAGAKAVSQTDSSKAASVPPPRVSFPVTVSTSDLSESLSFRSATSMWLWLSVSIGIIGQVVWSGLSVIVFAGTAAQLNELGGGRNAGFVWVACFAAFAAFVGGVLLARSFLTMWRSLPAARAQLGLAGTYLLCSGISLFAGGVSLLSVGATTRTMYFSLPLAACIALVWNGLRVLRAHADAASVDTESP